MLSFVSVPSFPSRAVCSVLDCCVVLRHLAKIEQSCDEAQTLIWCNPGVRTHPLTSSHGSLNLSDLVQIVSIGMDILCKKFNKVI